MDITDDDRFPIKIPLVEDMRVGVPLPRLTGLYEIGSVDDIMM